MPGDSFYTLVTVYNADAQAVSRSEIEVQSVLYKDGKEYQRGTPVPIISEHLESLDNSISLMRRFTLSLDTPLGDYVLQLLVTDKSKSKRPEGNATQTLIFTVVAK